MRALISNSNPAINTRSANYGVDRIGVMPNLKGILNALGAAPDVYLRDYVGDTGDVHAGAISLSPDIIVRPLGEANPDVTFGPGTESDLMLGPTATFGQDNYVYVRVWNRANVDAANVTATVFYAAVATLLMPVDWKLIGSVLIPNVAKNNVMTVSTPITWPSANVPAQGHYCFIALVGNAQDPAPNPATFLTFDNYYAFIRSNNNVTWRNFNVIDEPVPVLARAQERRAGASAQGVPQDRGNRGESYALEFSAPGAVDSDRDFVLAVGSRLPLDANLWLEAPVSLLDERLPITASGQEPQMGRVAIGPHGRTALPAVLFPARSRSLCRLLVDMPLEPPQANSEVYVSQLYEGFEVGRVTWRIIPKK